MQHATNATIAYWPTRRAPASEDRYNSQISQTVQLIRGRTRFYNKIFDRPSQTQKPVCGRRHPDGVGFYYNGQHTTDDAKFAEFPWTVAIMDDESVNDPEDRKPAYYVSTGSLIHPSVVLTAAHFNIKKSTFKVRAGITSVKANRFENELYPHQDRYVEEVKVHQQYDDHILVYDIALLFLASPMILAPNVGVVCLPTQNNRLPANIRCIGSGWGREKFGTNVAYRTQLKKFDLTLIDRYTCEELLQETRLGPFFKLHESFTCARDDSKKDKCQGDGGSPLGENIRYQQQGVASWGIGCGNEGIPLVYVDLSKARAWIDSAVVAKGFDPRVYTP
ncbi:Phenoloxidase-activating factor 2 [Eumeta japonica]|uniref:Phenoloxidase-activating factor 2 n=1 Tax=Eumeta variegata TaxID=151549 RepID=A0A4C1V2S4_EUMVA|nr:Phenoloxidase-activating factor 2 [Eumeta japonica]